MAQKCIPPRRSFSEENEKIKRALGRNLCLAYCSVESIKFLLNAFIFYLNGGEDTVMSKLKIKNENFYTVLGWMLNVLELKGNELIVFAIIYSFSQDGESEFTGSLSYLQAFANIKAQNTVMTMLKSLTDKNLIAKRKFIKDNVRRVAYKANLEYIDQCKGLISNIAPDNHLKK